MRRGPLCRPNSPPGAERRRGERHGDSPPLGVEGIAARVHDISRHGICLETAEAIALGEVRALCLRDERGQGKCAVTAEAVWQAGGRAGFRFVNWTPEQDQWLQNCFFSWLR